jgi:hypothetical protein
VTRSFRDSLSHNLRVFESVGIGAGESALFVNGVRVELDSFDIFQLLEMLKDEERLAAGFFRMGFRVRPGIDQRRE